MPEKRPKQLVIIERLVAASMGTPNKAGKLFQIVDKETGGIEGRPYMSREIAEAELQRRLEADREPS
jgi:hypothetical protein